MGKAWQLKFNVQVMLMKPSEWDVFRVMQPFFNFLK